MGKESEGEVLSRGGPISSERSEKTLRDRFQERHYSVSEIGEMWNLSSDVIREIFNDEPGVLIISDRGTRSKRRYRTLRIPETVMVRVHRRLSNPDITQSRIDRKFVSA